MSRGELLIQTINQKDIPESTTLMMKGDFFKKILMLLPSMLIVG